MISAKQQSRILGYIQKGVDEGATMLVGGTEPPKQFDKGFWVNPTLFIDVDNSMTIAQEEIFGPVLVVIPYEDEEEAIRIANDSVYGLAGNVMSSSLDRSLAVARRLRAGFIGAQRHRRLRRGYAVRRLQGQRSRAPKRHRGIQPVHGSEIGRLPSPVGPVTSACARNIQPSRSNLVRAIRRPRGLRVVRRRRLR